MALAIRRRTLYGIWSVIRSWESLLTAPTPDGVNSVPTCCGWRFRTVYWQYLPFPRLTSAPRERVKPPARQQHDLKQDIENLFRNRPWVILFFVGIGGTLAGWMLAMFHFVPNTTQSADTLKGIKLMISVFHGVLYMSCTILLWFYAIDHKTCLLMQEKLEKRREKSEIS